MELYSTYTVLHFYKTLLITQNIATRTFHDHENKTVQHFKNLAVLAIWRHSHPNYFDTSRSDHRFVKKIVIRKVCWGFVKFLKILSLYDTCTLFSTFRQDLHPDSCKQIFFLSRFGFQIRIRNNMTDFESAN